MSSAGQRVDYNDPNAQYLIQSPDPVKSVSEANLADALKALKQGAVNATREISGRCWTPGLSIVVVRRDQEIFCEGFGEARVGTARKIGPETAFACASLSKPVAATLLARAGASWDTSVGYTLFDESDRKTPLNTTLRQWLSHRSGLPDHAGDLVEDLNPTLDQHQIFKSLLKYQTGIDRSHPFRYTNFGFSLGCVFAAAKVAAEPTWEAASARWFRELKMTGSTYTFSSALDERLDRASPHVGQPDRATALFEVARVGWAWDPVRSRDQERDPTRQAPAGGLISCARDLGRLLSALNDTYPTYPPKNPPAQDLDRHAYSLGWIIKNANRDDVSFSHSGAFRLGAGTCMRFDPISGFGVAVLSNGEPTGVPEALMALFFNTLYGSRLPSGDDYFGFFAVARPMMLEQIYPTKVANYERYHDLPTVDPGQLPAGPIVFTGYSDYYHSRVVIERNGAGLVLKLGDAGHGAPLWELPLRCIDQAELRFVYDTRGENEVGPSAIQLVQENGAIVKVIDDWLNSNGPRLGEIDAGSAAAHA